MMDLDEAFFAENADEPEKLKQYLLQEKTKLENERRRLKEENLFFEKKLAILQDGFRQLEEDRRAFERQKRLHTAQRATTADVASVSAEAAVKRMFEGANNPLALRKRYRDLVKIFHPDNLFGDAELSRLINKEYLRRKEEG